MPEPEYRAAPSLSPPTKPYEMPLKNFFTGREPLPSRMFWLACLALCLIGLAFRLPTLGRSLWLDEAYSAWFSSVPLYELWHSVPLYETHPPMYYTLLKGWSTLFGNGEVAMRSLSVLATVATVLLLAVSGKVLRAGPVGERVGLLAALFLAVNKGNIEYAQQARPYGLETLTVTLAILFSMLLLKAIREQAGRPLSFQPLLPSMLGLGISAGMTLWLHNTAILICFGIWAALVTTLLCFVPGKRMQQAVAVGVPGVIALLIWSPFLPMFIKQNTQLTGLAFWIAANWKDPFAAMSIAAGGKLPLLPVTVLVLLGFVRLWRFDRTTALNLAVALGLPLVVVVIYGYLRTPIFIDRLFEWWSPSIMALTALGVIVGVRQQALRKWAALLVLALGCASTALYYIQPYKDWPAMVSYIATHAQPGDMIIASASEASVPLRYYARRHANLPEILYIPAAFPALGMKDRTYISNLGTPAIVPADRIPVQAALQTHGRIWFIEVRPDVYDPQGIVRGEILSSRKLVESPVKGTTTMDLFGL